jgi:hypothetical protein
MHAHTGRGSMSKTDPRLSRSFDKILGLDTSKIEQETPLPPVGYKVERWHLLLEHEIEYSRGLSRLLVVGRTTTDEEGQMA